MKKVIAILLTALMLFVFTACGDDPAESSKPSFLSNVKNKYTSSLSK